MNMQGCRGILHSFIFDVERCVSTFYIPRAELSELVLSKCEDRSGADDGRVQITAGHIFDVETCQCFHLLRCQHILALPMPQPPIRSTAPREEPSTLLSLAVLVSAHNEGDGMGAAAGDLEGSEFAQPNDLQNIKMMLQVWAHCSR
jgi:hypothetical protein